MIPAHPSPTQAEMAGAPSPAQPVTHAGMYSQLHNSPHSAVQQPIPPRPGVSHPPGGPHPPGANPGMQGLGTTIAPSPSNQPPPSVQSQEEAQEYDRKVRCGQEEGAGLGLWDGRCEGMCLCTRLYVVS